MERRDCIHFEFPFDPYPSQQALMTALYETAEEGTRRTDAGAEGATVGIFESPTGTGKSLSIICSLLKWLQQQEHFIMHPDERLGSASVSPPISTATSAGGLPDWLTAFTRESDTTKKAKSVAFANRTINQRISAAKSAVRSQQVCSWMHLLAKCVFVIMLVPECSH